MICRDGGETAFERMTGSRCKSAVFAVAGAFLAAFALSGCASNRRPPPLQAPPAGPAAKPRWLGERCAPGTGCAPRAYSSHRQYYDQHHRRYYYFDPVKQRYFWENGDPKR